VPDDPSTYDPDSDLLICVICGAVMAWALDDPDPDDSMFLCPNPHCPSHRPHRVLVQ